MPASTSRTPWRTFSGVSRLMRPSSSSSPQSPQVEPGGRCCHRFVTVRPPLVRCSVPTGWSSVATGVRAVREARFRYAGGHRMTKQDFVVSADGHLLEPIDLFKTRLPEAPARPRGVGGGLRDRAARRGRRPASSGGCTRRGTRAGRSRGTARRAGGRPRATPSSSSRTWTSTASTSRCMHPNLSLFGLYSDDHELSMAHARVYNDYVVERFTPYFDRLAPTAPIPLTDVDDAVAEIERVAAGGLPGDPAAGDAADAATTPATSTRCGRPPRPTACSVVLPHPDRRREGQRHRGDHAQGRDGERRRRSTSR